MPLQRRESPHGTAGIAVRGMLTGRDVAVIRRVVAARRPSRELILDLRGAPPPLAPALVNLAAVAKEARGRLRLLGLTASSERLLRMLGFELGPAREAPAEDVEASTG